MQAHLSVATSSRVMVVNTRSSACKITWSSKQQQAIDLTRRGLRPGGMYCQSGLREMDAGGPASLEKGRLVIHAPPRAFGKGWCPLQQHSGIPARNAGLSRQSGWCSPVMEGNKCPNQTMTRKGRRYCNNDRRLGTSELRIFLKSFKPITRRGGRCFHKGRVNK